MAQTKSSWTARQSEAISTTGRSLLVSAAAGSGKTTVLAERCAHLVCDGPERCEVENILVVTFTEAAAAEMKSRIAQTLRRRLDGPGSGDEHLAAQLALLDNAPISTIHAFCARLLRQNFHLARLDPNFGILDGGEAELLRLETARELFADRYKADEAGKFQALVDAYAGENDAWLGERVAAMYEMLRSLADPKGWLASARRRLIEPTEQPLEKTGIGRDLALLVRRLLDELRDQCSRSIAVLSRIKGAGKYHDQALELQRTAAGWDGAFGADHFDALATEISNFKLPRLVPTPKDAANLFPAKSALENLRRFFQEDSDASGDSLGNLVRFSAADWMEGMRKMRGPAELFLDLVEEYAGRYRQAKQKLRKLDFSDLEVYALRILCDGDVVGLKPSAVARACHRQFKHVLVDEYQDINEVQDAILRLVSTECVEIERSGNLFCVGDVKQSIYRFRLAEPSRFLRRDDRFRRETASGGGRVIDLQSNFRSRGPLLDALNQLFAKLMTRATADVDYDDSHRLSPALKYPPAAGEPCFSGAPVELHILPKKISISESEDIEPADDLSSIEREASFVAHRIHQMMGNMADEPHMRVAARDPETGQMRLRPLEFGDIVVLLRSLQHKAEPFTRILEQAHIPTYRDAGSGFFESMEVRDVMALLNVLDNQQQDIELAAILRGPISGPCARADDLAKIAMAFADEENPPPFHQAIVRYAGEKNDDLARRLKSFLKALSEWRHLSRTRPLAELIWMIYDQSGYLAWCGGLDNGAQRAANLVYLHERARQFGSFARQGLYWFLRFMESLERETELGQPSIMNPAANVVRVMSVHKAKGLEFPVVFLGDLGKEMNLRDCTSPILFDRHAYVGLMATDEERQIRYPSAASVVVGARLRREIMAEEMRILYVATTRAREHLVMVGTAREGIEEKWKIAGHGRTGTLQQGDVMRASTMLDWVGPAAMAVNDEKHFKIVSHLSSETGDYLNLEAPAREITPTLEKIAALKPLSPIPATDPLAERIIKRLEWKYPFAEFTALPAVQSVTAWAKHGKAIPLSVEEDNKPEDLGDDTGLDRTLPLPRLIMEEQSLQASPAEVGTATHLALERLDFSRACVSDDLEKQLQELVKRKLLLPTHLAEVNRAAIEWFVRSDLGGEIRAAASRLLRELPFYFPLAPQEFNLPPSNSPADQTMLRGRIDLLVPRGEDLVVVDYKTDRVAGGPKELAVRAQFYQPQVALYRRAVEKILRKKVAAMYLVFLNPRVVWKCP